MRFVRFVAAIGIASLCCSARLNAAALPSALDGGDGVFCHLLDGGVQCWGENDYGQLGNGTKVDSAIATDVVGLGAQSGVTAITVGTYHACAIANGGATCWGNGSNGRLGNGSEGSTTSPVSVKGMESGVVAISAGYSHTCAVKQDGSAWCWGSNGKGQLGLGPDALGIDVLEPTQVSGLEGEAVAIAAGSYHTCAVTTLGTVACWGRDGSGQLGNDQTLSDWPIPVAVPIAEVSQITAGSYHTCALGNAAGNVYCWGSRGNGQLGVGELYGYEPTPVLATDSDAQPLKEIASLSAGHSHTCVVTDQGAAKCFGYGYYGALGNTSLDRFRAWPVQGLESGVVAIAAGAAASCAIVSAGTLCWGSYGSGSLGDGRDQFELLTVQVEGGLSFQSLSAGGMHTCAVVQGGFFSYSLWCWGDNDQGQLGIGSSGDLAAVPVAVAHPAIGNAQITISVGQFHSCAAIDGAAKCWGDNSNGRLGDDTTEARLVPTAVSGLSTDVSAIDTSYSHTCAVVGDGARCWGKGEDGRLGFGGILDRKTPAIVNASPGLPPEPLTGVTALATGYRHTCAIVNESARCWGNDDLGQLGNGAQIAGDQMLPTPVEGLEAGVTAIDAGEYFTCAIHNGTVVCWGYNGKYQLGVSGGSSQIPVAIPGLPALPVVAIATGQEHVCALVEATVWCWGAGARGQLGEERPYARGQPKPVPGLGDVVSIEASSLIRSTWK